jgi:hypothetical protein
MFKVLCILCLLSLNSYAQELPAVPNGWANLPNTAPIVLTWVKAQVDKKIESVPTFMIQVFEKDHKFKKFISENKSDSSGCFELKNGDWEQTWCAKSTQVFALLKRGSDPEMNGIQQKLKSWVLAHD